MTRQVLRSACLLLSFCAASVASPSIAGLQNNYSFLLADTPNYGIARGSIFIIYGGGMAAPELVVGGFDPALDPNLGGVSVEVTVGGVTTEAIPYYVSATQISAILPSATPAGDGVITVTYNGETSPPFAIEVVESAFGLMTMSGNGLGQAVLMDADFTLLGATNPPVAGQAIILWGSGLGAFEGDETQLIGSPRSLDELPFELYIGNQLAETLYHGRSQFPALDQIVARIPAGISGCYVSVYVKTGELISNFTTIPVAAAEGEACGDPLFAPSKLQSLLDQETVVASWLYLGRFRNFAADANGGTAMQIQDSATAPFLRYSAFDYVNYQGVGQPSFGSCMVSTVPVSRPFTAPILARLDPGPISLTSPDGSVRNLVPNDPLSYSLGGSEGSEEMPLFVGEPGQMHTFTGPGSDEVGPFSASVTLPPAFTSDVGDLRMIPRSEPLSISWEGGAPGSFVLIVGNSSNETALNTFVCTYPVGDGGSVISQDVLSSLVPSQIAPGPLFITGGQLLVYNYLPLEEFEAEGVDNGVISFYHADNVVVAFE